MKKGLTLVEVLVSISIFVISFATCITVYFTVIKQETRQDEYLAFENVCLEIDKYSDTYGSNWNIEYFGNDKDIQYYDEKFTLLTGDINVDDIKYHLEFDYVENQDDVLELIVNIYEVESGRFIIKDLNYGGARYV